MDKKNTWKGDRLLL